MVKAFPTADERQLGGQNIAAPLIHLALAGATGPLAATGAGYQNVVVQQGRQQGLVKRRGNRRIIVIIDDNPGGRP